MEETVEELAPNESTMDNKVEEEAKNTPIHIKAAGMDPNFQNKTNTPVIQRTRTGIYNSFSITNNEGETKQFSTSYREID